MASKVNIRFIDFLRVRLCGDLPGLDSHKKVAPVLKNGIYRNFTPQANAKPSAVLLLLSLNNNGNLRLLFTLRSSKLSSHSGQISFPGGRADRGETPIETALRETYEEVGIPKESVDVIGKLSSLYVPHSLSDITPIVGYSKDNYPVEINENEVEEAFHVDFSDFLDKQKLKKELWNLNDKNVLVPFWDVHHSTPLWGATAIILQELLDLYDEFQSPKASS